MSLQLINLSQDLRQLRNEGYNIEIRSGHLLVKDVPYINSKKEIKLGILSSTLALAGDITTKPTDHVALFTGDHPCNSDGNPIEKIRHSSERRQIDPSFFVDHSFSAKPTKGSYDNYYEKMTTYVAILEGQAKVIDPNLTAKNFSVIEDSENLSIFNYIDTASSRAEINLISQKIELEKVAIIGLGGTGSYILDLIAKTPIKEIHLFDGDEYLQHNAFRSPGAPSIQDLRKSLRK